jgi:transposase
MFQEKINQIKDLSNCLFLGADIHKNNHTFVAVNNLGQQIGQCFTTDSKADLNKLKKWIDGLKNQFKSRAILGLEDSSGNGEKVSNFLVNNNYQVFDINPTLTAQRRKRTIHRDKSDLGDALLVAKTLISELDELPLVRITKAIQIAQELKGTVDDYDALVKNQTQCKNQLHRLFYRYYGGRYRQMFKDPFSQKALRFWLSKGSKCNEGRYINLDPEHCSRLTVETPQLEDIKKLRIEQKIKQIIFIKEQLKYLTKIMKRLFSWLPYQNLLSLDGCGIKITSRIVGEIKDINRFKNSSKLAKYAGLAPQENSSGLTKKHRKSKFGNRQLNNAFYRIALSQIGQYPNIKAKDYYNKKIKEGKTKKRALKSLVRRNVDIVYAMMKNKSTYDINYRKILT